MALVLRVFKHEGAVFVARTHIQDVIDIPNRPLMQSIVPTHADLGGLTINELKALMRVGGRFVYGAVRKANLVDWMMTNWDDWVRNVAIRAGATHYYIGNTRMSVAPASDDGSVEASDEPDEIEEGDADSSNDESDDGINEQVKFIYGFENTGKDIYDWFNNYVEEGTYHLKWSADGISVLQDHDRLENYFTSEGASIHFVPLLRGGG
ncbi:unnamed protein product [Effrenium voratum]|uniref:Uncharacterized protein n=1 Tax=Effrenium voratum TaxID=2562239 RepID=A0AA36HV21_9DINO|nr:unnamed protein product [Effrenium voratum]